MKHFINIKKTHFYDLDFNLNKKYALLFLFLTLFQVQANTKAVTVLTRVAQQQQQQRTISGQVTTADANVNYQLRFTTVTSNYSTNDAVGAYLVITSGSNGLPNIENITTAPEVIAYKKIGGIDGGTLTVNFSVPQISQISVGIVSTQTGEKYCNVKSWEIIKL